MKKIMVLVILNSLIINLSGTSDCHYAKTTDKNVKSSSYSFTMPYLQKLHQKIDPLLAPFQEPVLLPTIKQYDENGVLQETFQLKKYYANKVQYMMNRERLGVIKHHTTILAGMAITAGACRYFFPELVGPQLTLRIPTEGAGWGMWLLAGAINYVVIFPVINHVTSKASSMIDRNLRKMLGTEGQWDFSLGNFIQKYTYFVESADNLHKEVSFLIHQTDEAIRADLIDTIQDKMNLFLEEMLYIDGYVYLTLHNYKKAGKFVALNTLKKGYNQFTKSKAHFIQACSQVIKDLKENKDNISELQSVIVSFTAVIQREMAIVHNRFNYLNLIIQ